MTHRTKYLSFFIVAALVAIISYTIYKARSEVTPTFIKDITYTGGLAATTTPDFYGEAWTVASDSSGNVYFGAGAHIVKMNSSGEVVLQIGGSGDVDGKFFSIRGIAVDVSGNVYVSDYGSGHNRIQKFDSAGNFLMKFPAGWPMGVALDPAGNIYVSTSGSGVIQKFDAGGNSLGNLTLGGALTAWAPSMVSDSSGNIYIGDNGPNNIKKADSGGNVLLTIGTAGTGDGQFTNLAGVAVDASGNIYATDAAGTGRVQKFDSAGNFLTSFPIPVAVAGYSPGMTVDPSGNLYVADSGNAAIYKFDSVGTLLREWKSGRGPLVDTDVFFPFKLATDSERNVYAIDDNNSYIIKFNAQGDYIGRFGGYGTDPNQFQWPSGIAIDAEDNVYVTDCGSSVKKYSAQGTYLSSFGTFGTGNGEFSCPVAITFDAAGNIYVADDDSSSVSRIQKFDAAGNYLSQFGSYGSGDGQFNWPDGIAMDGAGSIYVSDAYNNRIQKFDSAGNFLTKFGTLGSGDGQMDWPAGVAVDAENNVYVVDWYNSYIQKFDSQGNFLLKITNVNNSVFYNLYDVFIDSSGVMFVADSGNNRISTFSVSAPPVTLVISDVSPSVSATSSTVTWTTDGFGTTQVEFGPTGDYGSSTPVTDIVPKVTSHVVTLGSLAPCSLYNYRVKSASATATTTSENRTFVTGGCTGQANPTSSIGEVASSTATSTVTLSTITLSIPPGFDINSSATTTFQAIKLESAAFFASSSVPEGTRSASSDVYHLSALVEATTTEPLTIFSVPLTVTLTYDHNNLSGINPATLTIYRYDTPSWTALSSCIRNLTLYSVTCVTSHFSDFALFGSPDTPSTSPTTSVSYGASGYLQPDGSLSSTPSPVSTGGPSVTPAPVVTPVVPPATTTVKVPGVTVVDSPSAEPSKAPIVKPVVIISPKVTLPVPVKVPPSIANTRATATVVVSSPVVPALSQLHEVATPVMEAPPSPITPKKSFLREMWEKLTKWWSRL